MTLHVVEPGLSTWVVDFGRENYRSLGVPVGGAADRAALALGNGLVGNPPDAAALEINLSGPTLRADCPLACVLYGAPFEIRSDRQRLRAGKTFTLQPQEQLRISGTSLGAVVPPPGYLAKIAEICEKNELLLIADEVTSGMGRTGRNFAIQHWDVAPDILVAAKGVSSG